MFPIVLLVAGLVLFIVWLSYVRKPDASRQLRHVYTVLTVIFLGVLLFLALSGRLHGLIALAAAVIPFVRRLLGLVRWLPFVRKWLSRKQNGAPQRASARAMTHAEALKVLGLDQGATKQQIQQAHRSLMQKLHPDHGGNDYLAAQLNQARDVLLGADEDFSEK